MGNTGRVTIDHVARIAGVSVQTVSRVLNDRPDVAPSTRARIKEIIRELGYQPSAIARSLASQKTCTLGLITADFSDYFFTQVIAGAEEEARRHGYLFMLGSTERNPADEPEYIRLFSEQHVAGFLFARANPDRDNQHLVELGRSGAPIVTTAPHAPSELFSTVDVDNVLGGQLAARHLVEAGHEQIAVIEGPAGWKSVGDRREGFARALQSAGLTLDEALVACGDWSHASGYQAMRHILERSASFTALFAHNDRMAIGAMRALRDAQKRIPSDVSVIGYDDIPAAAYIEPPLTTIRQPMREVGTIAARLLIQRIEQNQAAGDVVLLKPELVRRGT